MTLTTESHTTSHLVIQQSLYLLPRTHIQTPAKPTTNANMCTQRKTLYTLCRHQQPQKPHFCPYRYKFLIGHIVTPRINRIEGLCPSCLTRGKKIAAKDVSNEEESDDERIKRLWTKRGLREARERREREASLYRET
jgi:hypothetical protein